jgi:BlaI family transcriptional regulator, penicillinase repressor
VRRAQATLTDQELTIMKVVWRLGTPTVRDVYETLRATRPIAYTTVMTMMNILEVKGYLKKDKQARAYRYRPARPEQAVVTSMVREFVNRVFDGASRPLLLHLAKDGRLTARERDELVRLITEAD